MTELLTPRLRLRDFRDSDFEDVHAYASDEEVTQLLSWGPNTESDTHEFLERVQKAALAVPRRDHDWAIERRSDARVIGGCGLYPRTEVQGELEIGYCLARFAWGQGYGSEMVEAVLEYGFSRLGAHRIIAVIFPGNDRSMALAEKAGLRFVQHVTGQPPTFSRGQPLLLYARSSS